MRKRNNAPKLKQYAFTLAEYHNNLIDVMMEKYGFSSGSDVVRTALVTLYTKYEPPYRKPSPAGRMKEKILDKLDKDIAIPEEEFALQRGLDVFDSEDGNKYVLYRGLGHMPYILPLEGIKEWAEEHQHDIDHTVQDKTNEGNDFFLTRPSVLKLFEQYKIILPEVATPE